MILATYLRSKGFPNVECLDAQVLNLSPLETAEQIARSKPDVVGITAWTDFWYPTWETLNHLRTLLPDVILIIGGPHASVFPMESIEGSVADYLVCGDGEDILLNIVQSLADGRQVGSLPGLWKKSVDGKAIEPSEALAVVKDISSIPPPDRTLLPYKLYNNILSSAEYETTMVTSRGCPYACVFCKMDVQKVYARSAELVVEEFRQIAELGISDVQVYDDTFTWGQSRAIDICNGIIDKGIKVKWAIRDRANRVTPELYSKLKQAGCHRVHFGVETGSPRIMKNSGKFLTVDQVREAVKISREIDMEVMLYFMFGFLEETPEDAKMTMDFARELNPDYASFGILIPYPGTAIYKEGLSRGLIPRDYWRDFARNPEPDYRIPYVIEDKLDRKTLVKMKNDATRRFYWRPSQIIKELNNVSNIRDLLQKARLGTAILFDGINPMSVYRY
jgi:anaerobic magnesium-protoporphyrin IX monomethyl ester cyclase